MLILLRILKWSLLAGAAVLCLLPFRGILDRRYRPVWRYRLWMVLAVSLLLGPLALEAVLPGLPDAPIQITVPVQTAQSEVLSPSGRNRTEDQLSSDAAIPGSGETVSADRASPIQGGQPSAGSMQQDVQPSSEDNIAQPQTALSLSQLALPLWAAGAIAFLLWQIGQTLWLSWKIRRWRRPMTDSVRALCADLCRSLDMPCPRLMVSAWKDAPMVLGCISPVLVLPARPVSDRERTFLVLHELSHIRGRHLQAKALLLLANAVHWFNPLVWWMTRDAEQIMECLCDEAAVAGGDLEDRRAYCEVLLTHAAGRRTRTGLSTAFSGVSALEERIANLFAAGRRSGMAILLTAVLLLGLCACGVGVGGRPVDTPIPTFTVPPATPVPTEAGTPEDNGVPWVVEPPRDYEYFVDVGRFMLGSGLGAEDCRICPHAVPDIADGDQRYTFPVEDGKLVARDGNTGELLWEIADLQDNTVIGASQAYIYLASADGNRILQMDYHGSQKVIYEDTLGVLGDATLSDNYTLNFWGTGEDGNAAICRLYIPGLHLDKFSFWPEEMSLETLTALHAQGMLGALIPVTNHDYYCTIGNPDCYALYQAAEAAGTELTPEAKLQIQQENHTWDCMQFYVNVDGWGSGKSAMRMLSQAPDYTVEDSSEWWSETSTIPEDALSELSGERRTTEASSPEVAAELLAYAFLEDMTVPGKNRSFLFLDYREPVVTLTPSEIVPDSVDGQWLVEVDAEYCYSGLNYARGYGFAEGVWTNMLAPGGRMKFTMRQTDGTYKLWAR